MSSNTIAPDLVVNMDDRGETMSIIVLTMLSLSIGIVALRFWARATSKGLNLDDYLMLAATCLFAVVAGVIVKLWKLGGFRHLDSLSVPQQLASLKFNYIFQVFCVFDFIVAKAAVGFLVLRIIGAAGGRWRKWLLYVVMAVVAVTGSLDCIFTYVQCSPPKALWEPSIPHTCWNPKIQSNYAIFTAAVNAFADFTFAFVPASVILKLNMDKRRRINLSILLGLGVLAGISGIVKANFLGSLSSHSDLTWETYNLIAWSCAELFLLIFCGSISPLKPLWDRYVVRKPYVASAGRSAGMNEQESWGKAGSRFKSAISNPLSSQGTRVGEADDVELQNREVWMTTDIDVDFESLPSPATHTHVLDPHAIA
jgi:hypothetical protein